MTNEYSLEERLTLKSYDHLVRLSELMHKAAKAGDWSGVTTLEDQAQRVIDDLKTLNVGDSENLVFRQEKMRLLRIILAIDAQIRDLAQPRLAQLDHAMRAPRTAKRLAAAYGCGRFD